MPNAHFTDIGILTWRPMGMMFMNIGIDSGLRCKQSFGVLEERVCHGWRWHFGKKCGSAPNENAADNQIVGVFKIHNDKHTTYPCDPIITNSL